MWCSVADTHFKLLDRVVSQWCSFSNWGVFECNIVHRRSVAVLCMLYKIRCNPMYPLYDALPVPYVPVRVTRGALVADRYAYSIHRYRASKFLRAFMPLSVSPWNADPVFDGVGLKGFKSKTMTFLLA